MSQNSEKKSLEEAETLLENARKLVEDHKYKEAKGEYRRAIKILKLHGWFDQADVLYEEIKNLEEYKKQHIIEQREKEERIQKAKEKYDERLKQLQQETQKEKEERIPQFAPEIQRKIDKIDLALQKAQLEEEKQLYKRALGRYEYILELYNSIPPQEVELREKISEIKDKVSVLKTKI